MITQPIQEPSVPEALLLPNAKLQLYPFIARRKNAKDYFLMRLGCRTVTVLTTTQSGVVASRLLKSGCTGKEKPFESLGYKQALRYLRGSLTREDAIASTLIETRQYAKRQWTWFRKDAEIHWLSGFGDAPEVIEAAVALVREHTQ